MKQTFAVLGMACTGCAGMVEKALIGVSGVRSATVSLAGRTVVVDYDETSVVVDALALAVKSAGYEMVVGGSENVEALEAGAQRVQLRRTVWAWVLTAGAWVLPHEIGVAAALVCLAWCGKESYVRAFRQLRRGTLGMDSLVALSTIVTWIACLLPGVGMFHPHTPAMIMAMVLTGRCLEERARGAASSSIRRLMSMSAKTVRMVNGGEIPVEAVAVGDELEVRAGERLVVDGVVSRSESYMDGSAAWVDESMMTGEPVAVSKRCGDKVVSGSVVRQGVLHVKAQAVGSVTALSRMIAAVEAAQGSKAPVQRVADRLAGVFCAVIAIVALLTWLLWWLVGGDMERGIMCGVSVLVIACPCAMGLATPAALMVGIGRAAEQGILIKDAAALERIQAVSDVVMDKTGTLTEAVDRVDFTQQGLALEAREQLKATSQAAVSELTAMGVRVWLLSGDRPDAVAYWAEKAGIYNYQAECSGEVKEAVVKQLQQEGRVVAMAGDGVNDTAALARADVSIAMGKGTDVAMDVAQLTLTHGDLAAIPQAIALSRQTVRRVRENLCWAFGYNVICIPIAAGLPMAMGMDWSITPGWAAALMALSSLSVLLNSLRKY